MLIVFLVHANFQTPEDSSAYDSPKYIYGSSHNTNNTGNGPGLLMWGV